MISITYSLHQALHCQRLPKGGQMGVASFTRQRCIKFALTFPSTEWLANTKWVAQGNPCYLSSDVPAQTLLTSEKFI